MNRGNLPRHSVALLCVACCVFGASLFTASALRAENPRDLKRELGLTALGKMKLDALADEADQAIRSRRYVRAREIAEQILRADPDSPVGHATLGIVLHRAEGSLPRALYHLQRSLEQFEARYGPAFISPYQLWHLTTIQETAQLNGAMGRNERKLELLDELERQGGLPVDADRGWPLMRLRRYDEARASADLALRNSETGAFYNQKVTALNAICAIEGEQQRRELTYLACLRSADLDRETGGNDPVAYTNAAIGALTMLRMDEAERLILEGTENFASGTVANPWLDLMILYIGQGRMSEALDAMRRMFDWRHRQPPYMEEQNRAQSQLASALFLLVAGHPFESARIARRALDRPDRTGYTSSDSEQMESPAAIAYMMACRTAAQVRREEASFATLVDSLWLHYEALQLDLQAWSAARRAAALLSGERILISTLRPYLPGGAETSEWVQLELPSILGPGVVSAALERAREVEDLAGAEPYFAAFDATIAWERGDARATLDAVESALATLPRAEVLISAHLAAIGAKAASDLGDSDKMLALLGRTLQLDPGVLRRLDVELPVRFRSSGDETAQRTLELLRNSPRFVEKDGFVVETGTDGNSTTACLLGRQGEVYGCGYAEPRAGDDTDSLARRAAAALHETAFAPRINLTQADIQSLDGSPTAAGGRNRERMRIVLDGLVSDP